MPPCSAWPLLVYFGLVIVVTGGMLFLSYILGQRHTAPARNEPYESGILATGSARVRFDAKFYVVAVFFVIFDLEAAFIFAWAVALRPAGWTGYVTMLVFVGVLLAVLIYIWRLGALDWATGAAPPRYE
jgi:NADH-quinone oxidoreductase subunit A